MFPHCVWGSLVVFLPCSFLLTTTVLGYLQLHHLLYDLFSLLFQMHESPLHFLRLHCFSPEHHFAAAEKSEQLFVRIAWLDDQVDEIAFL